MTSLVVRKTITEKQTPASKVRHIVKTTLRYVEINAISKLTD